MVILTILSANQLGEKVRGLWRASTKEIMSAGFSEKTDEVRPLS